MIYVYKCTNKLCEMHDEEIKRICSYQRRNNQLCEWCENPLERIDSLPLKTNVKQPKMTGVKQP